jgi:hypothetical protein
MSKEQIHQSPDTLLEHLPNELLAHILTYLTGVDAVFAFSRLNNRFQCLLLEYCSIFDFKSISKAKFDLVTRQHETRRWRSLQLSNDDDTPGQINLFCQPFLLIEHIAQLQSLSLLKMKPNTACTILSELSSFTHLVSLTMESVCGQSMLPLDLPVLKRLVIRSCKYGDWMKVGTHIE